MWVFIFSNISIKKPAWRRQVVNTVSQTWPSHHHTRLVHIWLRNLLLSLSRECFLRLHSWNIWIIDSLFSWAEISILVLRQIKKEFQSTFLYSEKPWLATTSWNYSRFLIDFKYSFYPFPHVEHFMWVTSRFISKQQAPLIPQGKKNNQIIVSTFFPTYGILLHM